MLATVLFVGLTWLELGFGVTMNPKATALLGLGMLTLTVGCASSFSSDGPSAATAASSAACPVSTPCSAPVEAPPTHRGLPHLRDQGLLSRQREGLRLPDPCLRSAHENTYCITCMECVKTCPEDNMVFRARPWGADLAREGRPRSDEAYLALLMLAITGFHGLSMTPVWGQMLGFFESSLGLAYIPAFSLGMLLS